MGKLKVGKCKYDKFYEIGEYEFRLPKWTIIKKHKFCAKQNVFKLYKMDNLKFLFKNNRMQQILNQNLPTYETHVEGKREGV